jgi:hypothetical protein
VSGSAIIGYVLKHNAAVLALVPEDRIIVGEDVPEGTTLPAVSVKQVSGLGRNTVAMTEPTLWTDRIQVTAVTNSPAARKQLLNLIRSALPNMRATVVGFDVSSLLDDIEGPELGDSEAELYSQSQDYFLKWRRP